MPWLYDSTSSECKDIEADLQHQCYAGRGLSAKVKILIYKEHQCLRERHIYMNSLFEVKLILGSHLLGFTSSAGTNGLVLKYIHIHNNMYIVGFGHYMGLVYTFF